MMNLGQLRNYVAQLVDDPDQQYFTESVLNLFLNQTLKETQKLLMAAGNNWYVRLSSRALVQNQRDYLLPCNTLIIHRLELWQNGQTTNPDRFVLEPITLNQQSAFATYGEPQGYYLEKNYLILSPAPQNATKTMYLWHTPLVEDMTTDSDVPDLPAEFEEYLAHKAAQLCFVKDDRSMDNISPVVKDTEERLKMAAIQRVQQHGQRVVQTRGPGIISI